MFVVGANAAGKTNLLDALRFLHDIASPEGSLVRAVRDRGGLAHLRSLHARHESNVRIEVEVLLGDDNLHWSYALELAGTKTKPLRIEQERVCRGSALLLERPDAEDKRDERRLSQTYLEQISRNAPFRKLVDVLASIRHVHIVPQVAKNPARAEEFASRDAPGSDFIDAIARLNKKSQRSMLGRIEKLLRIAVPQFSQLRVERDDLGRPHLEANYKHWRPQGSWQNEQEFSDGTMRLVGLFWAILHGTAPLVVEEPELSLQRDVVRQLPRLMARASQSNERQIIVSTHAEEILGDLGVDPSEVVLLQPTTEETQAVLGSEDDVLVRAARARISVGRVVASRTKPKNVEQLSFAFSEGRRP